jgi:hypothetical protein
VSIDTPGARRAKTSSSWFNRRSLPRSNCIGVAISMSPGSGRPEAVTPTMPYASPSRRSTWPTTSDLAPRRRRQNPSETIATFAPPGRSSSARKSRPFAMPTPSVCRKSPVTIRTWISSGTPLPVRFIARQLTAAIAAKLFARALKST